MPVQVRFVLGPAGSGKTFRCLQEVKSTLSGATDGPPLIFLAPKQATFQLERQLLYSPELQGYTRLHILSFDRLANFILDQFGTASPSLLNEEGRMMVLRALLSEKQRHLKLFHTTARLPGFAQQLSRTLREFQQSRISPNTLRELSAGIQLKPDLRAKMSDFAALLEAYLHWLDDHQLKDAESLLAFASELLERAHAASRSGVLADKAPVQLTVAGLWLDGFAEMTPQELSLLAALLPFCDRATLAFCMESEQKDYSWLSTWSGVAKTFRQCHNRICGLPEAQIDIERLSRNAALGRFARSQSLQHLEQFWSEPVPFPNTVAQASQPAVSPTSKPAGDEMFGRTGKGGSAAGLETCDPAGLEACATKVDGIRIVRCANPEAEAVFAARELIRFVRRGNRFRDAAVLVRALDAYHHVLRRVFNRYEIPIFLDRREPVAHHPLAELTRSALRTIAFGWKQDDWFAALKTGLAPAEDGEIDQLENQALAGGWDGSIWRQPLACGGMLERLRAKLVAPFLRLTAALAATPEPLDSSTNDLPANQSVELRPNGTQLAEALEAFWAEFGVAERLDQWSNANLDSDGPQWQPVHVTVWQQMNDWRSNLAFAFPREHLTIREWLPILEAGLSALTVGVIPPALDQVLIGAVDRSRNPDLKLTLVLGMNESVFPAKPLSAVLLTESDRTELEQTGIFLGQNVKERIGQERYLVYIACTRPQEQLVVTHAGADAEGEPLNPSPFIAHLLRLFPQVEVDREPTEPGSWEHESELIAPILRNHSRALQDAGLARLETLSRIEPILAHWRRVHNAHGQRPLLAATAQKLYGAELRTSVSALEQFAACPFKFFVHSGLRAKERQQFEIDHREKGSFQHAVLQEFHRQLAAEGKRWRDVSVAEARARIARIGESLLQNFRGGLFQATDSGRFTARVLIEQLQELIGTLVHWMPQYEFDPFAVELAFGFPGSPLPGWRIELNEGHAVVLRGLIDRVDLYRRAGGAVTEAAAVVVDYKSSSRKLDPVKLQNRLELQLLAYLGLLRSISDPRSQFQAARLLPAGVFYVVLKPELTPVACRDDVANESHPAKSASFQHSGRFDASWLKHFDNTGRSQGDQFRYRFKKDGQPYKRGNDALDPVSFQQLLDLIEEHLRQIGNEIFAGDVAVAPYRRNKETACEYCEYKPICRFDPWVQPYRVLRARSNDEPC